MVVCHQIYNPDGKAFSVMRSRTCLLVSETRLERYVFGLSLGISTQNTKFVLCPVVERTPVLVKIYENGEASQVHNEG